jgi:hypothetical protein
MRRFLTVSAAILIVTRLAYFAFSMMGRERTERRAGGVKRM